MKSAVLNLVLVAICLTVQGQKNAENPPFSQWEYLVPTVRVATNKPAPRISVPSPTNFARPPIMERILNGNDATIEEYPYQLQLLKKGKIICGGVVISNTWALSAAHCVLNRGNRVPVRFFKLRAGATMKNTGGTVHRVNKIIIHNKFIPGPQRPFRAKIVNDIAILKVSQPFVFNEKVQPIALPFQDQEFSDGEMAVVTGFGRTQRVGPPNPRLQFAMVPVVNNAKCDKAYSGGIDPSKMICAGARNKGSCSGDSGGPVAVNGVLAGLVSFSMNCNQPGHPGVNTKVSAFRNYIRKHTGV